MRTRFSGPRPRSGRVAALIALAVVAATLLPTPTNAAAPVVTGRDTPGPNVSGLQSAPPTTQTPTASTTVTLATDDRIELTSSDRGRTGLRLLPGSPSSGEPIHTVSLAGELYVLPADRSRVGVEQLDVSMYNVTRIAELAVDGTVPVRVTFQPGIVPHEVPGIEIADDDHRTTAFGATVAAGSYDATSPLPDGDGGSWAGVTDVALPGTDAGDPEPAADDYELHTLTVKVRDREGKIPASANVVVVNVDNAKLFTWLDWPVDGQAKLSVPEGTYAVSSSMGSSTTSLAARPELHVAADTEVTLKASEATARVRMPRALGARPHSATFHYVRAAEIGGSWGTSALFPPGYKLFVQPAEPPAVGELLSGLKTTLRLPHQNRPDDLVMTFDWQYGVPNDFYRKHTRQEFADVTASYHADGRKRKPSLWRATFAWMPRQGSDWNIGWNLRAPMTRHEYYLGDPVIRWHPFTGIAESEMGTRARHYRAGEERRESWLRGPLHPGAGFAVRTPPTGPACPACRTGDVIRLRMASLTDSHGDHWGANLFEPPPWSLRRGTKVIANGGRPVRKVDVPARPARYSLRITNTMPKGYDLSTHSETTWRFSSRTSTRVLPLLMPRYTLPVDRMNRLPAGTTSFKLAIPRLGGGKVYVKKPTVRVSYNGGKTWATAKLIRKAPEVFRAKVVNPMPLGKPRYGSLKIRAVDRAGNTVNELIRRAWRIRGRNATDAGPATAHVPARVCGTVEDDKVSCLARVRAAGTDAMTAKADPAGYGAHDLRDAYQLPIGAGAGQTVAVVVAYDYPTAAKDLNVYRKQYGLPPCTRASGCFTKLNQNGVEGGYPRPNQGWALEAALDLQLASAACPTCDLVLVEAKNNSWDQMLSAVDTAASVADVVSHSYGSNEFTGVRKIAKHYNVAGVPMTVASGDAGYVPASFPSSIPSVISVGGTKLHHANNARGWNETVWPGGGSGCSAYFAKPAWQTDPACHLRTTADVAAVAAPGTGVAVYDSFGYYGERGWFILGGTSASAPLVAGMIAAAGDADGFTGADLYNNANALYDVVNGSNGSWHQCQRSYMCTAKPGYDAPTGNGTPLGLEAFDDSVP